MAANNQYTMFQLPAITNLLSQPLQTQYHEPAPHVAIYPETTMFKCDFPGCDRQFNRKYTLAEHAMTHTGEKPHVCPVKTCGKSFSTSGNLSRHKRLHGYIEPLQCPVDGCVCAFPSNNKLAKHMKFHFGNEDVKVCAVVGCGKTFSTTGNLNRHMKAMHDSDADADGSKCSSPVGSACSSLSVTRSPTAADQWVPRQRSSGSFEPDAPWVSAPSALRQPASQYSPAAPATEEAWNADVFDALATILDDHEAVAGPMSALLNCNLSVFQHSLQFAPATTTYSYRC